MGLSQFEYEVAVVWDPAIPGDPELVVAPGSGLPIGELPWWITGTRGFLAAPERPRTLMLPPAQARRNVRDTKAEVTFPGGGGPAHVSFSVAGTGQPSYVERTELLQLGSEARKARLVEMCWGHSTLDVAEADYPGLDERRDDARRVCAGENQGPGPLADAAACEFAIQGPWSVGAPILPEENRTHPIVLPYPETDILSLDVTTPPGFETTAPPETVTFESPYGRYLLSVTATETGYHVERMSTITALGLPASEYAPFREFFERIRKADKTALHFTRSAPKP